MKYAVQVRQLIAAVIFLLILPASLFAAPSLLMDGRRTAGQAADDLSHVYTLNLDILQQLRAGKVIDLSWPVADAMMLITQKKQQIRDEVVTWIGEDASGQAELLLSLGSDHLFGSLTIGPLSYTYTPDAGTGNIRVKLLDPAFEFKTENDGIPVPAGSLPEPQSLYRASEADDGSRIDVMVYYTNGMAAAHPGSQIQTRIQYLIDQGNTSFRNSQINTQFNLVHSQEVVYPDDSPGDMNEALDDLTDNQGVFQGTEELRTTHGADQVVQLFAHHA